MKLTGSLRFGRDTVVKERTNGFRGARGRQNLAQKAGTRQSLTGKIGADTPFHCGMTARATAAPAACHTMANAQAVHGITSCSLGSEICFLVGSPDAR